MKANLHQVDRIIRIVIGIALILLPLFAVIGWWGYVVGAILLATGLINFAQSTAYLVSIPVNTKDNYAQ